MSEFPWIEIAELREMVRRWDPEDHALDHPEKIGGGENDAQRGKGGRDLAPEERADKHEKFPDKTIGAGESRARTGRKSPTGWHTRHRRGQSDIVGDQPAVGALIDHPDAEE